MAVQIKYEQEQDSAVSVTLLVAHRQICGPHFWLYRLDRQQCVHGHNIFSQSFAALASFTSPPSWSVDSDISTPPNTFTILGPHPLFVIQMLPISNYQRPSEVLRMYANHVAAGAALQTPLGALTALPDPLAAGEGAGCPFPITPPLLLALRASVFHYFLTPFQFYYLCDDFVSTASAIAMCLSGCVAHASIVSKQLNLS